MNIQNPDFVIYSTNKFPVKINENDIDIIQC